MTHDAGVNPSVAQALESISGGSPELSSVLGSAPPMLGVPLPPAPVGRPKSAQTFQSQAAASVAETRQVQAQNAQFVAEAASMKGGGKSMAGKKFLALAALVPGAERVRIRRRKPDGSVATIKDYNKADVDHSGDIEAFIHQYLRPTHGGGEYLIALIDDKGTEYDGGFVRFDEPAKDPYAQPTAPPPDPAMGLMPLMVEMYRKSTEKTPAPDPLSQLRAAKELLMENTPKNDNSVLAMMMQMSQQQMQMQVQMQQAAATQAAAQQQQMMAMFTQKPAVDPAVTALLERMDRRLEKLETAPPPPPPAMPMGPPPPTHTLPELITAVTGAVAAIVPLVKGDPGVRPTELAQLILSAQQAAAPKDGLGVRDVIEIFKEREQNASPPATLEEQLGTLARVKEFVSAINPPQQNAQTGTTFWDAAIAILGNGSEISKAIGARVDKSLSEPQQTQQTQITYNRPVTQGPAPAGHMTSGPQNTQPAPAEEQVRLPANFPEKMTALEAAATPGERIQTTIDALLSLRGIDQWNNFSSQLLIAVAENERETALKLLGSWLKMLTEHGMIKMRETAMPTLKAFAENFTAVRMGIIEMVPDPRLKTLAQQADAKAAAAAQQAQQAQPTVQQPQPVPAAGTEAVAAPDEEETEEQEEPSKPTGPAPATLEGIDRETLEYANGSL